MSRSAVPIAFSAVLIDTIGFGIVGPVMPALVTRLGHIGYEEATRLSGYLLVLFAVTQFFAGPIIGNLADRFGRCPILIASMLAFGIDYALMAFAPTLTWLFLGRAVAGIAGAIYGPVNAVIADVTPPEKRAGAFGMVGAAFGIGFIIGPAIGGLLAGFGTHAPFIAAAVLALLNAAATAFLLPETLSPDKRRPFHWQSAHVLGALKPLTSLGATPLLAAMFLWQLAHMVYPATWGFWGSIRFGWDAKAIGLTLAYVGVVMAVVQGLVVGRIIPRTGERMGAVIGMGLGGTAFLAYALVSREWMIYPIFLLGALQGLVQPSMSALLSGLVDERNQGALQGGLASITSLSSIVGPLALTQALAAGAENGFPGAAFLLAALLAYSGLLIVWSQRGRVQSPSGRAAAG